MSDTAEILRFRYGENTFGAELNDTPEFLQKMIKRGSCRRFTDQKIDPPLIELLCAAALASPTKSDLQQRDIVVVQDPDVMAKLVALVGTESWVPNVPNIAVFCGNNRRQRQLHKIRGHKFANDHLDAFFNAAVDAGIALSTFVTAAESLGLGCCPISAVRNDAATVSALLGLPDHVFPVAGVAFGYPVDETPTVSMRLPLSSTVHLNHFSEANIEKTIADYDKRREAQQPYGEQLATEIFGTSDKYGWSEDKSRQYALPERQSFGEFVKAKGFKL